MGDFREGVKKDDKEFKKKELNAGPKASYGYGGEFGVQQDRMDSVCTGSVLKGTKGGILGGYVYL
jgi:cortactin